MQYPGYGDYESPPPTSYFRRQGRPWSPDPQDSLPPLHHPHSQPQRRQDDYRAGDSRSPGRSQRRRREPSEQSVEALDLADYNAIVQARSSNNNYAPFPPGHFEYPPSPPPARPFSVASRETPSLASSPDTLSSQSPAHSYQGHPRSSQSSRPFSLPPPRSSWTSLRTPPASNYNYDPHIRRSLDSVQERPFGGDDAEVDISRFPAWSRDWYAPRAGKDDKRRLSDRSFPRSPEHAAFFDPARASDPFDGGGGGGRYDPNFGSSAYGSSNRDRDLLPWSQRDMTYGAPLDEETKEERLQMLEREFGPHAPGSQGAALLPDRVVGSVDEKGSLITEGPRKRLAARILELLLALAVATSSFYALLAIHPKTPPPPQGKPSTYALYALSIISVLAFLWFFFLRPCCGRRKASSGLTGDGPAGLAVLPVHGLPGGKPPKKGKRGKKGRDQQAPVQVNLIVDPTAFMPGGMPGNREEDEDEDGESGSAALLSGGRKQPKRRGVFEGLAMERAWKVARKELKWMLALDILCLALWAVEFVWVVIGDKCTPGAFDGWCNAFNVATASACILAFTFALSVFFDIKDLHQSSKSPRTRP